MNIFWILIKCFKCYKEANSPTGCNQADTFTLTLGKGWARNLILFLYLRIGYGYISRMSYVKKNRTPPFKERKREQRKTKKVEKEVTLKYKY